MNPSKLKIFLAIVIITILYASVFPQTGTIAVIVKDPAGALVSNAQISIYQNDKSIKKYKTGSRGTAGFSSLSAGFYRIVALSKGFIEFQGPPFELRAAETKEIEITLEISPVQSEVDVSNEDSIDANDYGMVTVLTADDIAKLPDDPAGFLAALRRIAGDSITGGDLPISVNDIAGLSLPSKQLIEQIRIDRNPFSAKNAGTDGGGVQVYTSSSVKTFTGSASFDFADSRLNAKNPYSGDRRSPSQMRNYRFTLSGPLWKKTSFSISAERIENSSDSIVDAVVLDTSLNPVEVRNIVTGASGNNRLNLLANSSLSKKHKVTLNYGFSKRNGTGREGGVFSLPERTTNSSRGEHSVSMSDLYLGGPNFVNKFRISARYNQNRIAGKSEGAAINVNDSFFGGGANRNNLRKDRFLEFADDITRQFRKVAIEFGAGFKAYGIEQISKDNFNGAYIFNGRLAPLLDTLGNPMFDDQGKIITGQITSLESYRRTLLFQRLGYSALQIRQLGGGADQFSIAGGNPLVSASQIEYFVYAQASYAVKRDLGMSVGLRYENQTNIDSPLNIAPRFSVIWSPKQKKGQSDLRALPRISAGAGLAFQRFSLENIVNLKQTGEGRGAQYFVSAASGIDLASDAEILNSFPNVPALSLLQKISGARSQRRLEPDLQTPYNFISNVTVNKKLPAKFGVVFSATYLRSYRQFVTRNINAPFGGTFDAINPGAALYPFGAGGTIYETGSGGRSSSLLTTTNFNFPGIKLWKRSLTFNMRYSFGKTSDNLVSGSGSSFDPYDFSHENGPAVSDGVHNLTGNLGVVLPVRITMALNWTVRTGSRFNITTGLDSNGDGFYTERPAFATDPGKAGVVKTIYGLLDPRPGPFDKIIPRNLGKGPGSSDFNANFSRSFSLKREQKAGVHQRSLSVSMYVTNLFNMTNKANPIGNMASPRFIRILSGNEDGSDETYTRSSPRSLNFNLTFNF